MVYCFSYTLTPRSYFLFNFSLLLLRLFFLFSCFLFFFLPAIAKHISSRRTQKLSYPELYIPAALTFSNSTLCPHSCIYVFCVDLRTDSDYFPIQHLLTGLYNRDRVCLLRGTDWVFIYNSGYVFCVDLRTNSDYFPIQH